MEISNTDIMLLLEHILLLFVKMYAEYFTLSLMILSETPNKKNFMFIFKGVEFSFLIISLVIVFAEAYYISYYFIDVTLYFYEAISGLDQMFLAGLLIYNLKKGGLKNG